MACFRRLLCSVDNSSITDLVTYVQHQKRCKSLSVAMFLDVKRAYNNVAHGTIFDALESVGLRIAACTGGPATTYTLGLFMCRPMTGRPLNTAVPQGGVLSPTLFNVARVGVVERVPSAVQISMYADDICMWTSGVTRPQLRARLQKKKKPRLQYRRILANKVSRFQPRNVRWSRLRGSQ